MPYPAQEPRRANREQDRPLVNPPRSRGRREARRGAEPADAHIGWIAPTPHDRAEADADREMADAERDVAQGSPDRHLTARVADLTGSRTQEQRRHRWMHQ